MWLQSPEGNPDHSVCPSRGQAFDGCGFKLLFHKPSSSLKSQPYEQDCRNLDGCPKAACSALTAGRESCFYKSPSMERHDLLGRSVLGLLFLGHFS